MNPILNRNDKIFKAALEGESPSIAYKSRYINFFKPDKILSFMFEILLLFFMVNMLIVLMSTIFIYMILIINHIILPLLRTSGLY